MGKIIIPHKSSRLEQDFFERRAEEVAGDLLGRVLVISADTAKQDIRYARLHEVAAFEGKTDYMDMGVLSAPGTLRISTKYGRKLVDISTLAERVYSCVTLIAADVLSAKVNGFVQGPDNLIRALGLDSEFDGSRVDSPSIWIGGEPIDSSQIRRRNSSKVPSNCKGYFYFR